MRRLNNPSSRYFVLAICIFMSISGIVMFVRHSNSRKKATQRPVTLEFHRMFSVPLLPMELSIGGEQISLHRIYEPAGIDLKVEEGESLPDRDFVTEADLHALLSRFSQASEGSDKKFAAFVVKDLFENSLRNWSLDGLTIDFGQHDADVVSRRGFALFAAQVPSDNSQSELLLTSAHEFAHVLNIHHHDWEGSSFRSASTIEGYSNADTVQWRLSAASIKHLTTHRSEEIWPSKTALSFDTIISTHCEGHRVDGPKEDYIVVDEQTLQPIAEGCPSQPTFSVANLQNGLSLRLDSPKPTFLTSEPVVLTVSLKNILNSSRTVNPLLDISYGFLRISIRDPGSSRARTFREAILKDVRNASSKVLRPGESLYGEADLSFSADGQTFKTAGIYQITASFSVDSDGQNYVESIPLDIEIKNPQTNTDKSASKLIQGDEQQLIMTLNGGDHLENGMKALKQLAVQDPNSAYAPAVKLMLGWDALHPTLDSAHATMKPHLDEALNYLLEILNLQLNPQRVVSAELGLIDELDKDGRRIEASQIRKLVDKKFRREQSVSTLLCEKVYMNWSSSVHLLTGPRPIPRHWSGYRYPRSVRSGETFYIVKENDTVSNVARKYVKCPDAWNFILAMNPFVEDINRIYPGDPLILSRGSERMISKPASDR